MKHVVWFKRFIEEPDAVTKIRKEGGRIADSRYWDLLGLLFTKWDYVKGSTIRIDRRTIKKHLDIMRDITLDEFIIMLRNIGVFQCETDKDDFVFDSVILWDLMDSDSKYNRSRRLPTSPKKESKKESKSKINTIPTLPEIKNAGAPGTKRLTPDHVVQIWNTEMSGEFGHCIGLGGNKHLRNCLEAINYLPTETDWKNLFKKVRESDFLSGQTEKSEWKASLTWLVDFDNSLRVLNGDFNDSASIEALIMGLKIGNSK